MWSAAQVNKVGTFPRAPVEPGHRGVGGTEVAVLIERAECFSVLRFSHLTPAGCLLWLCDDPARQGESGRVLGVEPKFKEVSTTS